jgi:hypothetical protein
VRVVGNAFHPSGIDRVTVNGAAAAVTVQRSGVTRWVTTISGAEATRRVEIVAYPRRGDPIMRIQNPGGGVQRGETPSPEPARDAPAPLPSPWVDGSGQPLRVGLASLPQEARTALLAALHGERAIVSAGADAELQLRAEGSAYLVIGPDGSIRHRVVAPTAAAGATGLVAVLVQEYGARQLATLSPPARTFGLQLAFPSGSEFRVGDGIEFRVNADGSGYLTLVDLGTDGTISVLYPLSSKDSAWVEAGQELILPSAAARAQFAPDPPYKASPPTGAGAVRAFITARPLMLPSPTSGPISADAFLRALRDTAVGGEAWATAVLYYRIVP